MHSPFNKSETSLEDTLLQKDVSVPSNNTVQENERPPTQEIIVSAMPSFKDRLWKNWTQSIEWFQHWKHIFHTPIEVTPQYSPARFTSGVSPVTLHLKGVGFCIYNSQINVFNNSTIRLSAPTNTSVSILFLGWGQRYKYTLSVTPSIIHTEIFSVSSQTKYSKVFIDTPRLHSPSISISLPKIDIPRPTVRSVKLDSTLLNDIRCTLEDSS